MAEATPQVEQRGDQYDQFYVADKDPNYVYRWCNTDDRAMLGRQAAGYEVVLDDKPEIDPRVKGVQADGQPAPPSTTRTRGRDLVLCRIPRDAFEKHYGTRRKALEAQHREAMDDVVSSLDAKTVSTLRRIFGPNTPLRKLVFKSSDDEKF